MARTRKPLPSRKIPASPVVVRNVLDDLPDRMRTEAIRVAGGDATKVKVIRRAGYEVVEPAFIPDPT